MSDLRKGDMSIETIEKLKKLKKQANDYHEQCEAAQRRVIDETKTTIHLAKRSGDALREIKSMLKHGQWEKWVQANFKGGKSTARRYKHISENWGRIEPQLNNLTSINAATDLVKKTISAKVEEEPKIPKGFISRTSFLAQLESVAAGLSNFDIIAQSACFIFKDGFITTFNDEIACRVPTEIPITGAVRSAQLIKLLKHTTEPALKIEARENELLITAGSQQSGILMQPKILMPLNQLEVPKRWNAVDDDFSEALRNATKVAGTDVSKFTLCHVHIDQHHIEACDNFHAIRYKLKTGVKESVLIRKTSAQAIAKHTVKAVSVSKDWVHFKLDADLVISCRRQTHPEFATYIKLGRSLKGKGDPITFPKQLIRAIERAQVFSSVERDRNFTHVTLQSGSVKIRGEAIQSRHRAEDTILGWHEETFKCTYNGDDVKFLTTPDLFANLIKKYEECEIVDNRLIFRGENFQYIISLEEREPKTPAMIETEKREQAKKNAEWEEWKRALNNGRKRQAM